MRTINVAKDFSEFPAGRFKNEGPQSGEEFRDNMLLPALKDNERVVVELDGTEGYGSSFLEEVFGGAVRQGISPKQMREKLELVSSDKELIGEVWEYIDHAAN